MSDHSELKKLAEAATPGRWTAYDTHGRRFIEAIGTEDHVVCATPKKQWLKDSQYIAAANPVAVLALIAEVEGLRKLPTAWSEVYEQSDELDALRDEKLAWLSECDQLKADNDLQAKEIEALRKAVEFGADCFRKISSGDGSGHADLAESILRIAGSIMSKGDRP